EDLLAGRCYADVHTIIFPAGEIRGQIVPVVVPMDAAQEVPPAGVSSAAGVALVAPDKRGNRLGFDIRTDGLTGPESQEDIDGWAGAGQTGQVLLSLAAGPRTI